MTTKQKQFDVTCVDPTWNNREVTHHGVDADRLFQNDSGETRYKLNHFYTDVEVVSVVEVSAADVHRVECPHWSFEQYGTAWE